MHFPYVLTDTTVIAFDVKKLNIYREDMHVSM